MLRRIGSRGTAAALEGVDLWHPAHCTATATSTSDQCSCCPATISLARSSSMNPPLTSIHHSGHSAPSCSGNPVVATWPARSVGTATRATSAQESTAVKTEVVLRIIKNTYCH
eukprot:scpid53505/ scgid7668/ 